MSDGDATNGKSRLRRRLADAAWERHTNPLSGWSRVLTLPALMYGVYARRPQVVAAALGFAVLNPVLFPPPEDADAWMTRVVLGERMFYRRKTGRHPVELLSHVAHPLTLCALRAASRREAARTVLWTALAMATKFAFVAYVARYYVAHRSAFPEDVPDFDRAAGPVASPEGRP